MNLFELPPAVQKLASLGNEWGQSAWRDYRALGIRRSHIPVLIEIVQRATDFWEDASDDAVKDQATWTPMHAWRALGQMQAVEALPILLGLLRKIDEEDSDLIQEDLPDVFAAIGPGALSGLRDYLLDGENQMWARIAAAKGVEEIGSQNPGSRDKATGILSGALERYAVEDLTFNGFMISYLANLKAVDTAPVVEAAYQAKRVDLSILGDWEDFQIAIGLLDHRLNPPLQHTISPVSFSDGLLPDEDEDEGDLSPEDSIALTQTPMVPGVVEKKARKKRKHAKALHKKHAKKKK